jgi:hypothetical protein
MTNSDIELVIFTINIALAVICMTIGIVLGLHIAKVLGGGVMTMGMTWLIFIAILIFAYNLLHFFGGPREIEALKYVALIFLSLIPIFILRIFWGFYYYVRDLQKMAEE